MRKAFLSRNLIALLLAGCTLMSCAACGGGAKAATMHLRRTEGTVGVSDSGGKDVEPKENLGLYSGYEVDTRSESYAWVDLDSVKLTKLDENSEIAIQKDGKKLEIEVKSGSLFFNVTEPLADDETMEIRTSTMLVGIRGTCGWVTEDTAALLEGTVTVTAGEQAVTVNAGEIAIVTAEGVIDVRPFTVSSIPAFVLEEVKDDDDLAEAILEDSGLNVQVSMDVYTEILNAMPVSDGSSPGLLYSEILDFEADGNPELLVLSIEEDNGNAGVDLVVVRMSVYRHGPEGISCLMGYAASMRAGATVSLMESNGRLFLGDYNLYRSESQGLVNYMDYRNYYGSIAQKDGVGSSVDSAGVFHESDWGVVDVLREDWSEGSLYSSGCYFFIQPHGERGFITADGFDGASAEEFQTVRDKYTEVAVLAYSPDGKSVIVKPEDVPEPPSPPEPGLEEPAEPEPEEPGPEEPQQPEEPAEPPANDTASPLAPYAGTYTMYSEYEAYRSGYGGTTVTLNADGTVTGGAVDGRTPSSIRQESNGSIVIMYSNTMWFTLYPANGPTPSARWYDGSQVNLEFMDAGGGLAVLVYHADPASLG